MKKTFILSGICLAFTINVSGQELSKKEAQSLFDKAQTCLKTADTAAFINLWVLDNKNEINKKTFDKQDIKEHFKMLKVFLDTALVRNYKIDGIDIDKLDPSSGVKYKIKAWFKYSSKYFKGYGFLVDYIDNKWVFRFDPETSTLTRS